jgi:signal transduction histidine kinase
LLIGFYGLLFVGQEWALPQGHWSRPLLSAGLAVVVITVYAPTRAWLQWRIDRFFYGGWYDYRRIACEVSVELSQPLTRSRLIEQLLAVAQMMRFQAAVLFWREDDTLVPIGSYGYQDDDHRQWRIPARGQIANQLLSSRGIHTQVQLANTLQTTSVGGTLTEDEALLMDATQFRLWLPLTSRNTLRGVLILGERPDEIFMDRADVNMLVTLAGQAAVAAENVMLLEVLQGRLEELQRIRDELTETQERLTESREMERLHLARELHDGPVQDLYGVRFQLDRVKEELTNPELCASYTQGLATLVHVIGSLRSISGELRPPALAPFGLELAIRSHVGQIQERYPMLDLRVDLMHDGQALPDRTRLALFRIFQEALNNVVQHAQASSVSIRFTLCPSQIVLEISDDGCGFVVPPRWIELAREGHFGLLGATERAAALGGRLDVLSVVGEGTLIRVVAPLPAENCAGAHPVAGLSRRA